MMNLIVANFDLEAAILNSALRLIVTDRETKRSDERFVLHEWTRCDNCVQLIRLNIKQIILGYRTKSLL
jgi:hypothetical protein